MALTMEAVLSSSAAPTATTQTISAKNLPILPLRLLSFHTSSNFSYYALRTAGAANASAAANSTAPLGEISTNYGNRHWMVLVEAPPGKPNVKSLIIDYYVRKLEPVLGSKEGAQMCIYDASCDTHFGFCCDIDEERAYELASIPGVLSVKPDPDFDSTHKDYSSPKLEFITESIPFYENTLLFPAGNTKRWLVRTDRPSIGAVRKAQMVDYYVQVLMRVLRNEKDAQMCMYHVSWESNYGFCCELDDECAQELADVPGVRSVQLDDNFGSDEKDYAGENIRASEDSSASILTSNIKTKKLFVTGLSFYTSEKTLRSEFEGFGDLVEVKIIMDKISKRSKGYAFVEYTTEEAASTALREMNGKIINGWMITVDVAKVNPPKYSRGQPRPTF
ncbi:hypothetical protein ABFS82_06G088300 [Erythranthe guttata]|uniref:RRM domain-containing protein n=1 Tax=Erythranthe guttata TaxID=4155 RepID=A0A022PZV6_ERYGU|nr:PREDICTED: uncharacterized protein LOC105977985 [Erythranthe guttata]EYU19785.1 hypothetical protein MIMGU_mgv1a007946mg [Erythranthe guttata]|eukprot:XP_012858844.1 PREDICTED: uncharacterized protein LOC105977985 [Erythranthe guttata]